MANSAESDATAGLLEGLRPLQQALERRVALQHGRR
jgi:hypothetical protein